MVLKVIYKLSDGGIRKINRINDDLDRDNLFNFFLIIKKL